MKAFAFKMRIARNHLISEQCFRHPERKAVIGANCSSLAWALLSIKLDNTTSTTTTTTTTDSIFIFWEQLFSANVDNIIPKDKVVI